MQNVNRTRAGINDRIKSARSPQEIKRLVSEAKSWRWISPKTLRKVERVAFDRLYELQLPPLVKQ